MEVFRHQSYGEIRLAFGARRNLPRFARFFSDPLVLPLANSLCPKGRWKGLLAPKDPRPPAHPVKGLLAPDRPSQHRGTCRPPNPRAIKGATRPLIDPSARGVNPLATPHFGEQLDAPQSPSRIRGRAARPPPIAPSSQPLLYIE